ncbi:MULTISPECIES: DUF305 domain-containing protein [Rhodococcus]|uniref:DUF305 domain-containing protein n=2 Tax=Rhodococcus aetherivorans TaxID=191292 RepID=A0A059MI88_9NOCA|nr:MULTISPECIES: DUF305 domain-containing protein [Rhodococcus]ETT23601.1 protein of unknown function DUF305 [Rhodococcus rhodochrous ATCC 21198]NCL78226.1 hypothetical protein [Rhodococcus sp. YH1]ANZ27896.1 DUF305 domain-containing protein [Rhodococcus sp. WB1]KDE10737.1 hypothetical protein N505_0121105 [Rhodococcus aetherivorans]MBC2589535.1 DUF305 domain-containing protein [Rhodococcus aetherivorans]
MRKKSLATGAVAVAAALTLAACSDSGNDQASQASPSATATTSASAETAADHNQADVTFAQQMIPHHSQAIEMSDVILAKEGIDPRVTELAQQIKAAQGPEIEQLQSWLTDWGQPTMPMGTTSMPMATPNMPMSSPGMEMPGHDMPMQSTTMPGGGQMGGGMSGMMSAEDMTALRDAQGVDASRLFLTQMIEHHRGAIAMAQTEVDSGQNSDAVAMARTIAETQQQEITTMENILSSL